MQPDQVVLGILNALPSREIRGKKRLQKMAYLLKQAGLEFEGDFQLQDFGPFSREVAQATNLLALTGKIEETEKKNGSSFMVVYKLDKEDDTHLRDEWLKVLKCLDEYTTIELEVAATVEFFRANGCSYEKAQALTREMKPTKAISPVLDKCSKILECLNP